VSGNTGCHLKQAHCLSFKVNNRQSDGYTVISLQSALRELDIYTDIGLFGLRGNVLLSRIRIWINPVCAEEFEGI